MYIPTQSLFFVAIQWGVLAISLWVTAAVVPGFRLKGFGAALIAALILAGANWLIRPFLFFITLPLNVLTFGLFTFVVNGIVLKICASLMRDFEIASWWAAIFGALILAVVRTLIEWTLF